MKPWGACPGKGATDRIQHLDRILALIPGPVGPDPGAHIYASPFTDIDPSSLAGGHRLPLDKRNRFPLPCAKRPPAPNVRWIQH